VLIFVVRSFHGAATVGMLGVGHSIAYLAGAVILGVGLHRRTGSVWPKALVPAILAITPFAVVAWWVGAEVEPQSRVLTALLVVGLSIFAAAGYLLVLRLLRRQPLPLPGRGRAGDLEPADAALEP
jgi:hypothetical protein